MGSRTSRPLTFAAVLWAGTAPAAPGPGADQVAELIGQLGAADFKAREAATKKLMDLGPSVLDALQEAIANGLYRDLARRLDRFETAKPKQIFRRFLDTPARISVSEREVRVRLSRRAHHPILLASGLLDATPAVPWWAGRRLRLEIR